MDDIKVTAGAIIEAMAYTFTDADGTVVDLTGLTCQVSWERHSTGETGLITSGITNGETDGTVTFYLPEELTATGPDVLSLVVWAGDSATVRYDGRPWTVRVAPAIGTPTN